MNTKMKTWCKHFEYPHNGHECIEECKAMLHDQEFIVMASLVLFLFLILSMVAVGLFMGVVWPEGQTYLDPLRYYPMF